MQARSRPVQARPRCCRCSGAPSQLWRGGAPSAASAAGQRAAHSEELVLQLARDGVHRQLLPLGRAEHLGAPLEALHQAAVLLAQRQLGAVRGVAEGGADGVEGLLAVLLLHGARVEQLAQQARRLGELGGVGDVRGDLGERGLDLRWRCRCGCRLRGCCSSSSSSRWLLPVLGLLAALLLASVRRAGAALLSVVGVLLVLLA
jgi:hypothetical protein